jgi:hypothetical protein
MLRYGGHCCSGCRIAHPHRHTAPNFHAYGHTAANLYANRDAPAYSHANTNAYT